MSSDVDRTLSLCSDGLTCSVLEAHHETVNTFCLIHGKAGIHDKVYQSPVILQRLESLKRQLKIQKF